MPVVVDTRTQRVVAELGRRERVRLRHAFSPDGRTIMAVVADPFVSSTLQRFDARTGKPVGGGRRRQQPARDDAGRPSDGRRVVTSSTETDTVVHDATTLRPLRRWPRRTDARRAEPGRANAAARRRRRIGAASSTCGAERSRDGSGGHDGAVARAAFSPDGKTAITAAADSRMIVWDVERASVRETLDRPRRAGVRAGVLRRRRDPVLEQPGQQGRGLGPRGQPAGSAARSRSPTTRTARASRFATTGASSRSGRRRDDRADRRADAAPALELSARRPRGRSPAWATCPARACSSSAARTASWPCSIRPAGGRSGACEGQRAMSSRPASAPTDG